MKVLLVVILFVFLAACTANESSGPSAMLEASATEAATIAPSPSPTLDDTPRGRGELLFHESRGGFACATCHYISAGRLIGPGLSGIAERFASYELEGSLEDYLLVSILNPREYVAHGEPAYPENIMPINYAELFTEEEIQDIIAYILSL